MNFIIKFKSMKPITIIFLFMLSSLQIQSQINLVPLDKELTTVEYPFPVKYYSFDSQRQLLKMAYIDEKPTNFNGKVVLLLHGKIFNAAYWGKTIQSLLNEGFRVVAPDQIGFGKSSKPQDYQFSFHQLAYNTKAILDSLKIRNVSVLGHSMGGMLATRFALTFPEMTEKLILENPIGLEDYKILTKYITIDDSYQSELKNTAESYRKYQLTYYYDNKWKSDYEPWLNLLSGWTLHPDYPIVAWNAAQTTDMIFTQPVVYEFNKVSCPTLLIIGTRDRTAIGKERASDEMKSKMGLYYELGKTTQKSIPNSKLVELDNVGHLPHIEAFDRFILPLIAFLKS